MTHNGNPGPYSQKSSYAKAVRKSRCQTIAILDNRDIIAEGGRPIMANSSNTSKKLREFGSCFSATGRNGHIYLQRLFSFSRSVAKLSLIKSDAPIRIGPSGALPVYSLP